MTIETMVNQRWRVDMGGKNKVKERRTMEAEKGKNRWCMVCSCVW